MSEECLIVDYDADVEIPDPETLRVMRCIHEVKRDKRFPSGRYRVWAQPLVSDGCLEKPDEFGRRRTKFVDIMPKIAEWPVLGLSFAHLLMHEPAKLDIWRPAFLVFPGTVIVNEYGKPDYVPWIVPYAHTGPWFLYFQDVYHAKSEYGRFVCGERIA